MRHSGANAEDIRDHQAGLNADVICAGRGSAGEGECVVSLRRARPYQSRPRLLIAQAPAEYRVPP